METSRWFNLVACSTDLHVSVQYKHTVQQWDISSKRGRREGEMKVLGSSLAIKTNTIKLGFNKRRAPARHGHTGCIHTNPVALLGCYGDGLMSTKHVPTACDVDIHERKGERGV